MKSTFQPITAWAEDDRPREKMMLKGKNALSDAELLAILIGTGSGPKTAVDLGRELLKLVEGDLYRFGQLRVSQLCEVKGIGASKAVSIMAALELGRRRKEYASDKARVIMSPRSTYEEVKPFYSDLQHEEFYALYLNRANEVLQIKQLSVGGTAGTYVDVKLIFKLAMDCGATAVILTHNHPSGQLRPSLQDIALTKRIVECGSLMDIPVLDHVIIADNGYFSFSDEDMM